jgi:predicted RNase H-like HicB family nuclease/uncharacterized damage-inducible protein DinB
VSEIFVTRVRDDFYTASVPAIPGCVGTGATREDAVAAARANATRYLALLSTHNVRIEHDRFDVDALEVRDAPEPNTVPSDFTPMEEHELRDFLHRFQALHAELLQLVAGLSQEELERRPREGEWSLRETLQHVASGTVDILARLEPWPRGNFGTLQAAHRVALQRFSVMDAADAQGEHTILGRRWTTKKVARRLLEHEFEHLRQVEAILAELRT